MAENMWTMICELSLDDTDRRAVRFSEGKEGLATVQEVKDAFIHHWALWIEARIAEMQDAEVEEIQGSGSELEQEGG